MTQALPTAGMAWLQCTVLQVDRDTATVRDQLGQNRTIRRDIQRAKGKPPEVGETWIIDRTYGNTWTFACIVGADLSLYLDPQPPTSVPIANADFSNIVLPYPGLVVLGVDNLLYRYTGVAWVQIQVDKPACTFYMNTTKSINNMLDTDVQWDNYLEDWVDPSGLHMWDASQPSRMAIRKGGYYTYGVSVHYAQNATGKRTATITLNGTGTPNGGTAIGYDTVAGNTATAPNVLRIVNGRRFSAGDILRCSTWQSSTVSLNIVGNTIEGAMYFWAAWQKP